MPSTQRTDPSTSPDLQWLDRDRSAWDQPARDPFGGVIAATVTPCKSAGVVDPAAMTRLCRNWVTHGCHGVFVVSSTGEMPLLDERDRAALVAAAAEGVEGRGRLFVGISGTGLNQSIRYAESAAAAGADAAVVMAPFFLHYSQPELVAFVLAIADASPIPVAVYHHLRMPTPFDVDSVARIAEHPNIVAMKDSSADLERMEALVRATAGRSLCLLQGSEPILLRSLRAGAGGMVTALASIAPEVHAELYASQQAGDLERAQQCQDQIERVWRIFSQPLVRQSVSHFTYVLKRTLVFRGWLTNTCGMIPGTDIGPSLDAMILEHLQAAGWIENRSS